MMEETTSTQNMSLDTNGCIAIRANTVSPWASDKDLVSEQTEELVERIKSELFIPVLYVAGLVANCVCMLVFYRQGLREKVNLCLFSLAVVDSIYLTTVFLEYSERLFNQFTSGELYGPVFRFLMNQNVIGLFGFGYSSMFVRAVIACERCVCILSPLRYKKCLDTKTTAFIVVLGSSLIGFLRFVINAQYSVFCFYDPHTHTKSFKTYVNDFYFENEEMIIFLDSVFYGFFISLGCSVVVVVATCITAHSLEQTVKWRGRSLALRSNLSPCWTGTSLSSKEIALTKMLIGLSAQFCILTGPYIALRLAPIFGPGLTVRGDYRNTYLVILSVAEIFSYLSSSVNFFVYYVTGTKFRESVREMVRCHPNDDTPRAKNHN